MKASPPHRRSSARQRGSILVVCLVLAALGTLGAAAWFSLLDARSHQVEAGFKATERRAAAANARALARLALYAHHLHADAGLASDAVLELPHGKGRATIRAYSTVPLRSDTLGPPARNGATPLSSHSVDVAVDIHDGAGTTRWIHRLRNQHPVLAGELLSLRAPVLPADGAPLVSGSLRVKGRAAFWDAVVRDFANGLRADEFLLPAHIAGATTFTTASGGETLPLNYPHYLRTVGTASEGPAYRGELELLDATVNPQGSYLARIASAFPLALHGAVAQSQTNGPPTRENGPDDPVHLAFIDANPPAAVAAELSQRSDLSSIVLLAAVAKANPALSAQQLFQIFDAQSSPPDDALSALMAAIDEDGLGEVLDMAIASMNARNGALYTGNGDGTVQLYLDHPELNRVVVEDVSRLRLFGQSGGSAAADAAALPPLVLVVDNRAGRALARIDLLHENHRPLVLVLASPRAAPAMPAVRFKGGSPFPVWRAVVELQHTGLAFDLSAIADARILGGIRGNHRLSVAGGALVLERDPHAGSLAPHLSRDAWIETARQ